VSVLVATDLDRTIIYSRRAMLPGDEDVPSACVETYEGRPASFMTRAAAAMLAQLARVVTVVPVTGRVPDQLARVKLPMAAPAYSVAANGGLLLVAGVADRGWSDRVSGELAGGFPLAGVWEHVTRVCDAEWTRTLRNADGLFVYAVVDRQRLPVGFTDDLAAWAAERGWRTSLQGRKLYLVPERLTKSAAVAEVARRVGATVVLAAGDALLDTDLLLAADRAVRPRHGELFERGWSAPGVDLTAASGIAAGEEIVAWFLAQLRLSG
jgi:hydroxymethylpyrimidine pyrophosphatase-like HAD family hydrolase